MNQIDHISSMLKTTATTLIAAAVISITLSSGAWAQITGTKHDLSAQTAGTDEICVFCHTPHGSDNTAAVPLWNRVLADPTTFTLYDVNFSNTIDSTVDLTGSVSLACLSCHDGSQAIDTLINAPGSGGYNSAGATQGWTGLTGVSGITDLGTDLSNDHPVGIKYAGAGGNGLTAVDDTFVAASNVLYDATKGWWVETGGNTTRNSTDLVLYSRSGSPYVECGSCHDPHTVNSTFLRISNAGSAVCKACHNK